MATIHKLCLSLGLALIMLSSGISATSNKPVCLYVNSYEQGHAWSDGIFHALTNALQGRCTVSLFEMKLGGKPTAQDAALSGRAAFETMKHLKPDVVITSDDHAARHFIVPFAKDVDTPIVFAGIDWSVEQYNFPAANVTGIIEVAPIDAMLSEGLKIIGRLRNSQNRLVYLGANTDAEHGNYQRVYERALQRGFHTDAILVEKFSDWQKGFKQAQQYDLIIVGDNAGITEWDERTAARTARESTTRLSVTNHQWMMPYTVIGYTKVPEEHGEWAAATAVAIIEGIKPADIPVVTNSRWDTWINETLRMSSQIELDNTLIRSAKIYP